MHETRNSAIVDKPRDAFVQIKWRGCFPHLKHAPPQCRYKLPRQTWSFYVKGCEKGRKPPKLGVTGAPTSLGRRRGWP